MLSVLKKWIFIATLMSCAAVMAQSEPTLNQVYEAAQAGKLVQAQEMMRYVLVAHPNSAKAHFVAAELSSQQGDINRGKEELALAEKLAPGLPFAKPEAVQKLRTQLAATGRVASGKSASGVSQPAAAIQTPAERSSPFPWGLGLALGGAAIALVVFLTRKKAQAVAQPGFRPADQPSSPGAAGAQASGMTGPQTFGSSAAPGMNYGPPVVGQPAGGGMAGRMAGGLATGLAVGAGVMAAESIGRNLMGHETRPEHLAPAAGTDGERIAGGGDLGGQDFGINDASSWDDAGTDIAGGGDGGDWDS